MLIHSTQGEGGRLFVQLLFFLARLCIPFMTFFYPVHLSVSVVLISYSCQLPLLLHVSNYNHNCVYRTMMIFDVTHIINNDSNNNNSNNNRNNSR